MTLNEFLSSHSDPSGRVPVSTLFRAWRKVEDWSRTRFIVELTRLGVEIGVDSSGRQVVVGYSLAPPKWAVVGGRVVRARQAVA
jgi:hypothetical protein